MTVQVGLLAEAAVTQVAFERFLFVVDVADVTLQVGGDAERTIAVFTPAERTHTHTHTHTHKNTQFSLKEAANIDRISTATIHTQYPIYKTHWCISVQLTEAF